MPRTQRLREAKTVWVLQENVLAYCLAVIFLATVQVRLCACSRLFVCVRLCVQTTECVIGKLFYVKDSQNSNLLWNLWRTNTQPSFIHSKLCLSTENVFFTDRAISLNAYTSGKHLLGELNTSNAIECSRTGNHSLNLPILFLKLIGLTTVLVNDTEPKYSELLHFVYIVKLFSLLWK